MTTTKKKKYWTYIIYIVLIALVLWPTSRAFFQQQLMKIGFFQPKMEQTAPREEAATGTADTKTPTVDQASFITDAGVVVNTEDLKGKVVFINLWATWCGPCIAEMPSIQVLYNIFKDNPNVVFLLVEVDNNVEGAKEFVAKQKLTLPIVYPNSDIPRNWLDNAIPTTVILAKNGMLAERKQGMYDYSGENVQNFIQSLIDQK